MPKQWRICLHENSALSRKAGQTLLRQGSIAGAAYIYHQLVVNPVFSIYSCRPPDGAMPIKIRCFFCCIWFLSDEDYLNQKRPDTSVSQQFCLGGISIFADKGCSCSHISSCRLPDGGWLIRIVLLFHSIWCRNSGEFASKNALCCPKKRPNAFASQLFCLAGISMFRR